MVYCTLIVYIYTINVYELYSEGLLYELYSDGLLCIDCFTVH